MKLLRKENHNKNQEVSTFLVGVDVELQVLHTKGSNKAQSWDYPTKPNGKSTLGASDVISSFDFTEHDNQ